MKNYSKWTGIANELVFFFAAFIKGALFTTSALLAMVSILLAIAHIPAFADMVAGEIDATVFLILTPACMVSGGLSAAVYAFMDGLF